MAGSYPNGSDNKRALWLRIASNLYSYAVNFGVTGLTPPSWNDSVNDLARKSAYYTAAAVDIHP